MNIDVTNEPIETEFSHNINFLLYPIVIHGARDQLLFSAQFLNPQNIRGA